jgi:hypothetical protein
MEIREPTVEKLIKNVFFHNVDTRKFINIGHLNFKNILLT